MWCFKVLFDIFMAYFEQEPPRSIVAHLYTEAVARRCSSKDIIKYFLKLTGKHMGRNFF